MSQRTPVPKKLTSAHARLSRLKLSAAVASMLTFAALTTAIADQVDATWVSSSSGNTSQPATDPGSVPAVPDAGNTDNSTVTGPGTDPNAAPPAAAQPIQQPQIITATS
jgi:hypothetical protein